MTDEAAATPPAETPAVPAGAAAPAATEAAPPAAGTPPAAAATPPADTSLLGAPEVKEGETPAVEAPAAPEGAPDAYEFAVPEGVTLPEGKATALTEFGKKHNLSQSAMAEVLALGVQQSQELAEQQVNAYKAISEGWANESRADKEIGGANLAGNVKLAQKAIAAFGEGTDLVGVLNSTGLGNHPAMIKVFARIGKDLSEDTAHLGGNASGGERKSTAEVMYPNMTKKP